MKILFIGDIFGKSGRKIIKEHLTTIKQDYKVDFVIANAENSSHGKGLVKKSFHQLKEMGIDFITMGNHTWFREDIVEILENEQNIIRPLNLTDGFKYSRLGFGTQEINILGIKLRVTNLLGNSVRFLNQQTNCFIAFKELLDSIEKPDIHIVDLHAETTSEKNAFLWEFDGKVSAILGTHTHIPTNDAVITKNNTAYITDVGMTGPSCGVIGGEKTSIIKKFLNPEIKFTLEVEPGPKQLCAVLIEFDLKNKIPISIKQIIIKEGFKYLGNTNFIN